LLEDSRNTRKYCGWVVQLIHRHLGTILSNPENKAVVGRLRMVVGKKIGERENWVELGRMVKDGKGKDGKGKEGRKY